MSSFRSLSLFTKLLLFAFLGLIVFGLTASPPNELPGQSVSASGTSTSQPSLPQPLTAHD